MVGVHRLLCFADGDKNIVVLIEREGEYRAVAERDRFCFFLLLGGPDSLLDVSHMPLEHLVGLGEVLPDSVFGKVGP